MGLSSNDGVILLLGVFGLGSVTFLTTECFCLMLFIIVILIPPTPGNKPRIQRNGSRRTQVSDRSHGLYQSTIFFDLIKGLSNSPPTPPKKNKKLQHLKKSTTDPIHCSVSRGLKRCVHYFCCYIQLGSWTTTLRT